MAWHFQLDNPNFLGWSVVSAYLLAAISCGWVASKTDKSPVEERHIWWTLAGLLTFLGINKQLNLQTLMLDLGRHFAVEGGWYGKRRLVQAIFAAAFAAVGLLLLWLFAARSRRFIGKNRLAFAGMLVLLFFVVLRSSTINHANDLFGLDPQDDRWAWILEISGSALIVWSAVAAAKSADPSDRTKA